MARGRYDLKLYTVVEVWRGIATGARNFIRLRNAQKYMRRIRRGLNLAEDDVQLFESPIRFSAGRSARRK